eukprot:COSAG01_NODE_12869_length_1672_cov_2.970121_1_plen_21_part_10
MKNSASGCDGENWYIVRVVRR